MNRGGTITWYLDANDADFLATMLRVRNEAKRTGNDVDRTLKKGFGNAKLSLDDFHRSMGRSASAFRNFQIALRGLTMTSLIVGVGVAGGAIIELVGALTSLVGLLYAAPAAIGVFAGAMATIKVATGGVGDAFKALTKQSAGVSAASTLAKRQSDILKTSMKQDANLVRRLTDLNEQYGDTLKELANERMQALSEQILKGAKAWGLIASAAGDYLQTAQGIAALTQDVTDAQQALNTAMVTYGPASQQAITASRDLFAAQAKVASANAQLDSQYGDIKDSVKDLATNLDSLRKANRNEMAASLLNLKAMRLDKQARGESIDEITDMVAVLEDLVSVKDTKLSLNPDLAGAQADLDAIKQEFPNIAVAAATASSSAEDSLTKSLKNIADSMEDVRRQRAELQSDLSENLAEAAAASAASGTDPFAGLSKNARAFVIALKDVQTAFQPIKELVQDNFFAGLDTAIKSVANTTFPILKDGLGGIATAMNGMIHEAARVMQQPFFTGAMAASMETTKDVTNILTGAVEPLARAFTDLMNIGNPYMELLSHWVVKQVELAAAFTGSKDGQDSINGAIQGGIKAMKVLGKFLGEILGLFGDLFKISADSGMSLIGTLTEIVQNVRAWLKETENQAKMQALFEATSTILKALADTLGPIIDGFLKIVKAYTEMDKPAKDLITNIIVFGAIAGPILSYISGLFASMTALFVGSREVFQIAAAGVSGISNAVKAAPAAIEAFKLGMDGLMVASDGAVGAFGKIGNGVNTMKTVFKAGVDGIVDYGKFLGAAALDSGKQAATIAANGAKAAAGWVVDGAKILAGWAASFAGLVARGVVAVASMVAQAAVAAGAWIAGAVATAAAWVVANAAMLGIWGLIILAVVGAVALIIANWDSITAFFGKLWDGIKTAFSAAIEFIVNLFNATVEGIKTAWGAITGFFGGIGQGIKDAFNNAWNFVKGIWNGVTNFFSGIGNGIANVFNNAVNGVKNAFNDAINFIRGVPGNILNMLGNLGSLLWNAGGDMIRGLINGIGSNAWAVVNKITEIARGALDSIKKFFGIRSPSRVMAQMGSYVMEGFGNGIDDMAGSVANSAQSAADGVMDAFSGMQGNIGSMQTDFGVNGTSTLATQFAPAPIQSQLAPAVLDPQGTNAATAGGGVTINQTNEVHSELDMEVVNRNLAWELNKI